jgi:hypothetical protein
VPLNRGVSDDAGAARLHTRRAATLITTIRRISGSMTPHSDEWKGCLE